jgi:hypothetical protein
MLAEKKPKDLVDYGPGDIDGQHCGACRYFIEPNHCEKVSGRIRSGGWCRLFERAGKTADDDKEETDDGAPEAA